MRLPWGEYLPFGAWLGGKIERLGFAIRRASNQRLSDRRHARAMRAAGYQRTLSGWVKIRFTENAIYFDVIKGFRGTIGGQT